MRESGSLNEILLKRNRDNMVAVEYAMKNGSRQVIPLLITPATVSQISGYLGSPLHYAAAKGSPDVCALLLRFQSTSLFSS